MSPIEDEMADRIRIMTRQGMSATEIAVQLRCSTRTVVRRRKLLGIAKPSSTPLTAEQHARAVDLAADGASIREIARSVGCSPTTILRHYPHAAWTPQQVGAYGRMVRSLNEVSA